MGLAILASVVGTLPHEGSRGRAALPDLNFWTPELAALKAIVEKLTATAFNSCLLMM